MVRWTISGIFGCAAIYLIHDIKVVFGVLLLTMGANVMAEKRDVE